MKAREEKLLSQPLSHEEAGTPGLGEDLALSFKTSKCQPPLRAEEAEDKWGGGKPGMIRATGAVGIRTAGLGGPLSADPKGEVGPEPHMPPLLPLPPSHLEARGSSTAGPGVSWWAPDTRTRGSTHRELGAPHPARGFNFLQMREIKMRKGGEGPSGSPLGAQPRETPLPFPSLTSPHAPP